MAASRCDLLIEQGVTFSAVITLKDEAGNVIDLSGYVAAAAIKQTYSSVNTTAVFTCAVTPLKGEVLISLSATQTSAIPVNSATTVQRNVTQYVWDLKLTSNAGIVTRVLEGLVSVSPQVTV